MSSPLVINKMLLKVMNKVKKRLYKMFTIRNIKPSEILCVYNLTGLIRTQLKGDVVAEEFDVGYVG